ncbi:dopamine receptor 3-like [Odontomachus brunneus]|uniref:dopamine receptor 3-like n=1 Tax=Odontomachus brunneus TaxID=486640 RepID=UPI0013F26EF4|nr:dopamine receptor 3-like [Odontomachus brunneus]
MFSFRKRGGLSISQIPMSIGDLSRFPRSLHREAITVRPNSSEMEMAEQLDNTQDGSTPSLCFLLDFFHMYYIPLIILLGLVGNLLSCIVFLKTQLRTRSSSYYLAALSIADSGFLVTLFLVWLNSTVGWQVFNKEGWCETLVYVSSVCSSLSIWLIVAFTVERYIAFRYPLHRPYICTVERAKSITLVLVLVAMLLHMYAFFFAGVVKTEEGDEFCDLRIEHLEAMRIISIIDSIISLIAPIVGIIVMNTMIVKNLLLFRRLLARNRAEPSNTESEHNDVNDHTYVNDIPVGLTHGFLVGCTRESMCIPV